MTHSAGAGAGKGWRAAALTGIIVAGLAGGAGMEPAEARPAAPSSHGLLAAPASGSAPVILAGGCKDNGPGCPPPPGPPCQKREPYAHPRSNIGMREMWELITHGAPMPGTDYYYFRMHEYKNGRIYRPRKCGD